MLFWQDKINWCCYKISLAVTVRFHIRSLLIFLDFLSTLPYSIILTQIQDSLGEKRKTVCIDQITDLPSERYLRMLRKMAIKKPIITEPQKLCNRLSPDDLVKWIVHVDNETKGLCQVLISCWSDNSGHMADCPISHSVARRVRGGRVPGFSRVCSWRRDQSVTYTHVLERPELLSWNAFTWVRCIQNKICKTYISILRKKYFWNDTLIWSETYQLYEESNSVLVE